MPRAIFLNVIFAFLLFCFLMAFASCLGLDSKRDINRVGKTALKFTLGATIALDILWYVF